MLSACTCAEPAIRTLHAPEAPVAVSGEAYVSVSSRSCRTFFFDKRGAIGEQDRVCAQNKVTLESAEVDDPAVFDAEVLNSAVRLAARAPGTTRLVVEARDLDGVETFEVALEARRANRIEAELGCDKGVTPVGLYAVNSRFRVNITALDKDTTLVGVPVNGVRADVATFGGNEQAPTFTARSTAGLGRLSSEHDPSLNIALRIFSLDEISVSAPAPVSVWGANTASFQVDILVDGQRPCIDALTRRFEVLTTDVCTFSPPTVEPTPPVFVHEVLGANTAVARRLKQGICTVRGYVVGRADLPVDQSFTF